MCENVTVETIGAELLKLAMKDIARDSYAKGFVEGVTWTLIIAGCGITAGWFHMKNKETNKESESFTRETT